MSDLPEFYLGPFADDLRRFVSSVLGLPRHRIVAEGKKVAKDEKAYAVLIDDQGARHLVLVTAGDEPNELRSERRMRKAQQEANAAFKDYQDELARAKQSEDGASEQIEEALVRIKQAEHDLADAKHRLRSLEQGRSTARTRLWLAMDTIAGFGTRNPN
ncbi:MAG: hypothetical protein PF961_04605 [Planctomycetota bacterium]|jgi:hypothetical protein|nr:hypothetical protein [Planctomycetota bacterium]